MSRPALSAVAYNKAGAAARRLLNTATAADYLSISMTQLKNLGNDGRVRTLTIGSRTLYDVRDLDAFVDNLLAIG